MNLRAISDQAEHIVGAEGVQEFEDTAAELEVSLRDKARDENRLVMEASYGIIQDVCDQTTLVLRRSSFGSSEGKYDLPGGKKDNEHDGVHLVLNQEAYQEIGAVLSPESILLTTGDQVNDFLCSLALRALERDMRSEGFQIVKYLIKQHLVGFRYNFEQNKGGRKQLYLAKIFRYLIGKKPEITLSEEHDGFEWVSIDEAEDIDWARGIYRNAVLATAGLFPEPSGLDEFFVGDPLLSLKHMRATYGR